MNTPSYAARPTLCVYSHIIGDGFDREYHFSEKIEPGKYIIVAAADYDALRDERDRLAKDYRVAADLAKQSQDLALQQCARAEAAEAKVAKLDVVIERAERLVKNAHWGLGGALSSKSRAKEIPSKAGSNVSSRNLASLRDALAALNEGEGK